MPDLINTMKNNGKLMQPYFDALQNINPSSSGSSSNAALVRAIVLKLLSDSNIYNGYDEIKEYIIHHSLCNDEKILATLELFSYSTYHDYIKSSSSSSTTNTDKYLPLSETHLYKLRQLSLLQLIYDTCYSNQQQQQQQQQQKKDNKVSYGTIQDAIQLSNQRDIEQMIASLIASNVINGKLSQKFNCFIIHDIYVSRDVHPESITTMIHQIQLLQQKLSTANANIQNQQDIISKQIITNYNQMEYEKQQQYIIQQQQKQQNEQQQMMIQSKRSKSGGMMMMMGGGGTTDPMDVELFASDPSSGNSGGGTGGSSEFMNYPYGVSSSSGGGYHNQHHHQQQQAHLLLNPAARRQKRSRGIGSSSGGSNIPDQQHHPM